MVHVGLMASGTWANKAATPVPGVPGVAGVPGVPIGVVAVGPVGLVGGVVAGTVVAGAAEAGVLAITLDGAEGRNVAAGAPPPLSTTKATTARMPRAIAAAPTSQTVGDRGSGFGWGGT